MTFTSTSKVASWFDGTMNVADNTIRATSTNEYGTGLTGVLQGTVSPTGTRIVGQLEVIDESGATTSTSHEVLFVNDDHTTCPDHP